MGAANYGTVDLLSLDLDRLIEHGAPAGVIACLPDDPNPKLREKLGVTFWALALDCGLLRVDLPNRKFAGWSTIVVYDTSGPVLGLRQLLVTPATQGTPTTDINVDVLRSVRLGMVRSRVHVLLREVVYVHVPRFRTRDFAKTRRPGRKGRDDLAYAKVAAEYVQHLGDPTPVKTLAAKLGYSTSLVRNVLHEAAERELLEGRQQGRAGGRLTDKARRLIDGAR
jgi:hypothetical protein